MEEKEKNQKTLIAIVAGLIIGGLLVWVFSSAPSEPAPEGGDDTLSAETEDTNGTASEDTGASEVTPSRVIVAGGSVAAPNQEAGPVVTLGDVSYPSNAGWIVVREELAGGNLGNILGASRFNAEGGLNPKEVRLLRNTEPNKTYHVMIYSENGDNVFDLADDMPVETAAGAYVEAVFTTT